MAKRHFKSCPASQKRKHHSGNEIGGGSAAPASPENAKSPAPQKHSANSRSTDIPVHWELATVHTKRGGSGQTPYNAETQLSRRFDALLNQLTFTCSLSRSQVADKTVVGHNLLLEQGLSFSLLDVMEEYNQSLPRPMWGTCDEWFAVILTDIAFP
jgi:hypothetical protein